MCRIVIYYLFPGLSWWNSSVIKLFVHPLRTHMFIYKYIFLIMKISSILFVFCHTILCLILPKVGRAFFFLKMTHLFLFISLKVTSFQRECCTAVMHGTRTVQLCGSASSFMPKRTYAWTSKVRPRGNNWQEGAKEAGERNRRRLGLYNYTLKMAYLPSLPARSCLLS